MNGIMLDTVLFNRDIRYPGGVRADSIRPYSGISDYFSSAATSFPSRVKATAVFLWVKL